jgi:hypothetical protein
MAELYPTTLPCPTWQYGQGITRHVERTRMESGWSRQRRRWPSVNTSVNLSWQMDTAAFNTWAAWIEEFGYDWFTIELDRYLAGNEPTDVRLVEPFQYSYDNFDKVNVVGLGEFFS